MYPQQSYVTAPMVQVPYVQPATRKATLPSVIPALVGVALLILWLAVLGLEGASVYYDPGRGTIYAGGWCSIIFFLTWVSTFCFLCCGKTLGCGIYLIIQHINNIIFSSILIAFTSRFIDNPCLCYGELCSIPNWDDLSNLGSSGFLEYGCTPRTLEKVPVLKGLLACAILILCISVAFILAYLIALLTGRTGGRSDPNPSTISYHSQPAGVPMRNPPMQQFSPLAYPPQQQFYNKKYQVEMNNYETVTEIF